MHLTRSGNLAAPAAGAKHMSNSNPSADDRFVSGTDPDRPIEDNLKSRATWMRALYMLICCALIGLASAVGSFVVVLGFLWVLFTGSVNQGLQQVGRSLASYIQEIVLFLTFNSDDKPFPLGNEWPSGKA
jgi:hypothetical protein